MKKFKFTISGNDYEVHIKDFDDNVAEIEVNGTPYKVEVHQEVKTTKTPRLVRKPVVKNAGEGLIKKSDSVGEVVNAPLPGTIISVAVKEGDSITTGQILLVMEAMKMENNVLAESDGTVGAIKIAAGDTVLQDDVLIEMQ
jgi:biotin carboxyl carrier protein